MKSLNRFLAASAAALVLATLASPVLARGYYRGGGHGGHYHGGWRGSVVIGVGPYWGWGWGAPYYGYYGPRYYYPGYYSGYYSGYYPGSVYGPVYGPVYADPVPRTYVERDDVTNAPPAPQSSAPAQNGGNWWYWCEGSRNYYPYVKECPGGWRRVPPQPTN